MSPTVLSRLDLRGVTDLAAALPAPDADDAPRQAARDVIAAVRARGDEAVRELTRRLDGCDIPDARVSPTELVDAVVTADGEFRAALARAASAVRAYHEAQLSSPPFVARDGMTLHELDLPVARAGCYVPGGRAAYPSTVLMTVIPAQVAGVHEVVLCAPPGPDGEIAAPTLAAAQLLEVDEVYRIGGAQAVAAMAYGTETIRPVDVIVGPGNAYVAAAKREVAGVVGTDSFAGPSEIVIVADDTAPPEFVAADLIAQAEHGPGGTAVLVTWEVEVADAVDAALAQQLRETERAADVRSTLASGGLAVVVEGSIAAMEVVNTIAPEHLQLMTVDPRALLEHVRNAGAVFLGPWSPAALGDYVAGVNHVLPTARTARFTSALRVDTFRKHVHVVEAEPRAVARLADDVEALATVEGLPAHARSVELRRLAAYVEESR